jgi:hypothetical protein
MALHMYTKVKYYSKSAVVPFEVAFNIRTSNLQGTVKVDVLI